MAPCHRRHLAAAVGGNVHGIPLSFETGAVRKRGREYIVLSQMIALALAPTSFFSTRYS